MTTQTAIKPKDQALASKQALLQVNHLSMQFGGLKALNDIHLSIEPQTIYAIIGPNGAGKTTLFNCLTGFYKPSHGQIWFEGQQTQQMRSHQIARLGITRTFQTSRLFKDMTVVENCLVAQHNMLNRSLLQGLFNTAAYQSSEQMALKKAYKWLEICQLAQEANHLAGTLSYGKQRLLEIARAMCTKPRLLCLDEPAAGLNPQETQNLRELVLRLRNEFKTSILLIEHDMSLIMTLSDRITVLDHGEIIATGSPIQIQQNPKVIEAYLGSDFQ